MTSFKSINCFPFIRWNAQMITACTDTIVI